MIDNLFRIQLADFEPGSLLNEATFLTNAGYSVISSTNGPETKNKAIAFRPHIIIVDFMSNESNGVSICQQLRSHRMLSDSIIVLYSWQYEFAHQNIALNSLLDGFMKRPMPEEEFLSHIRHYLKKAVSRSTGNHLEFDGLRIDVEGYVVRKGSAIVEIAKKEFELLLLLASEPEKIFSRDEIIEKVWGDKRTDNKRLLDVYIAKLRSKIGKHHIHTMKGVGYAFSV